MTKTSKQFSKTGLTLAILLAAFDGEGRAQEETTYPPCIDQQCMINCVNTIYAPFNPCVKAHETTAWVCIPTPADAAALDSCVKGTYTASCPSNISTIPAVSHSIAQSLAIDCLTTFQNSFTGCLAQGNTIGGFGCAAVALGTLSTCITKIPANQNCTSS